MNNAIMIHVHKDMLPVYHEKLLEEIRVIKGVKRADIIYSLNYWLNVVYETKSITSKKILKRVMQWDKSAILF
jgi:hypothetical protein